MADFNTVQTSTRHVLTDWRPDDSQFWQSSGKRIANRNLWISIPALLLAFSVGMVWSVVVAKLPLVGFTYSTEMSGSPNGALIAFLIFYVICVLITWYCYTRKNANTPC